MTGGLGFGGAYGATIERIKAQGEDKSRLGMTALMWTSHAERPLNANELCHAVAIELGFPYFNADAVPSMSTLVGCCQGLITVDAEASTVRLIHFTLQEYLSATPDIFSTPHSTMAEICLTYLNSEQVKAIPANSSLYILDMPFLKYCSLYWGVHAKREHSDHAMSLSLELLSEYDGHISGKLLLANHFPWRFQNPATGSQFNGLHCASFFGIADLVAALIEIECCDINDRGFLGYAPLGLAAHYGHEEVVKILLAREEVNPDKPDDYGRTPLLSAAQNGHEGVVEILLGRKEVNPDNRDIDGKTPLLLAAWYGYEGVVKLLLDVKRPAPTSEIMTAKHRPGLLSRAGGRG